MARPEYGYQHEKAREVQLREFPWCQEPDCGAPATVADHVPPLSVWKRANPGQPWRGGYRSQCRKHSYEQAGRLGRIAQTRVDAEPLFVEPEPIPPDDVCWQTDWLADLFPVPDDARFPRFCTRPHADTSGSYGFGVEASASRRGVELRWWQRFYLRMLLQHDEAGRLLVGEAFVTARRQVGKTVGIRELCWWRIETDVFDEVQRVLHTGPTAKPARDAIIDVLMPLIDDDRYRTNRSAGVASIERLSDGARWAAMSPKQANGQTAHLALIDEAWKVTTEDVDENIGPTTDATSSSQTVFASAAHSEARDMAVGRRILALEQLHEPEAGMLIVEWSAPRDADDSDPVVWRDSSPVWLPDDDRKFAQRHRTAARDPKGMASFRAQRLNIWPLRPLSSLGGGVRLIEPTHWATLTTDLADHRFVRVAVALEDRHGLGVGASAVGQTADGLFVTSPSTFETRAEAWGWLRSAGGSATVIVSPTLFDDPELGVLAPLRVRAGTTETRIALPLVRELAWSSRLLHLADVELDEQVSSLMVRSSSSAQLVVTSREPSDLVRTTAWAVRQLQIEAGQIPRAG